MSYTPRREVHLLDFAGGAVADCINNDPLTGTDFAPILEAAIAAACNIAQAGPAPYTNQRSGRVIIDPAPYNRSYRLGRAVRIEAPVEIIGYGHAKATDDSIGPYPFTRGQGRASAQFTLSPGCTPAGFSFFNEFQSPNGGSAEGSALRGVEIFCTPTVATVAAAPNTNYNVGDVVKFSNQNTCVGVCVVAGATNASPQPNTITWHVPNRAVVWSPGMRVFHGMLVRPTANATWAGAGGGTFFATVPADAAAPLTTGAVEPAWDFANNSTTLDNGITWTCEANITDGTYNYSGDNSLVEWGTAVFAVTFYAGIYATCKVELRDFEVHDSQTVAVSVYGSAPSAWGSDGTGSVIDRFRLTACAEGIYLRGGQLAFCDVLNGEIYGTAASGQGNNPINYLGPADNNQHGVHEASFIGGNCINNVQVQNCGGFDFLVDVASSAETQFIACNSQQGRICVGSEAAWMGAGNGAVFWTDTGAPNASNQRLYNEQYGSTAGSVVGNQGAKGFYEAITPPLSTVTLTATLAQGFSNDSAQAWVFQRDPGSPNGDFYFAVAECNSPITGWYGGFNQNSRRACFAVSGNQAADGPTGFWHTQGFFGDQDNVTHRPVTFYAFGQLEWQDSNLRNGSRNQGDMLYQPSLAIQSTNLDKYLAQVALTNGFNGSVWTPLTIYNTAIAPGTASYARPASIIQPTASFQTLNPASAGKRMQLIAGATTGAVEPNWNTLVTPGVSTIVDGGATWLYVGNYPTMQNALRVSDHSQPLETTDATTTTLATYALPDQQINYVDVLVTAKVTGGADGASFKLSGAWLRSGGAPVQVRAPTVDQTNATAGAAAWTAVLAVSANNILVQVTGAVATNVNWACVRNEAP